MLHRVQVSGHEYALLTGTDAVVEAEDVTSNRADRAGVGLVHARAHFRRLTITAAGTFGGLQCVASDVRVEGLRVDEVAGLGVSQRDGSLQLEDAVVSRTRDPESSGGDGMQLRGGRATLTRITLRQAAGACLLAAEGAEVHLSEATLEGCHTAGLAADTGAHLTASGVTVQSSDGPGAVATGGGRLSLDRFQAQLHRRGRVGRVRRRHRRAGVAGDGRRAGTALRAAPGRAALTPRQPVRHPGAW